MIKHKLLHLLMLCGLLLVIGCTEAASTPTAQIVPTVEPTDVPIEPTDVPIVATDAPTAIVAEVATEEPTVESAEPTAAPTEPVAAPTTIELIEVTYFTPSQTEGPYYPVSKPVDHDNNLVEVAGASGTPAGQILDLSGKIYDATGMPLSGVLIEIWHTDDNGIYDHPGDRSTASRDMNFQFYGEATTAADGSYSFRTIIPGKYEPRPVHIHYKVKADGRELLTSQMYFEGDPDLANDGIFSGTGDGVHMLVALSDGQDETGSSILIGERDVVLSVELPAFYPDMTVGESEIVEDSAEIVPVPNTLINLNDMTQDELLNTIPNFSNRMVREFFEYQPYISIQQFRREMGKYIDDAQIAEYEQYVYVPVDVDESDAATLMQIPGIDQALAEQLMAARPFGSNEVFLNELGATLSAEQAAVAAGYLR